MLRRNKTLLSAAISLFLAAEVTLSVLLHSTGSFERGLSYSVVALAFFFCLGLYRRGAVWPLTVGALAFTLGADYFLVLRGDRYLTAMLLFSVVQLLYAARLLLLEPRRRCAAHLGLRGGVILAALLATRLVAGEGTDALALVALFYFANLLVNTLFAFLDARGRGLLPYGLLLFVFCDIFVGFGMLDAYLPLKEGPLLSFLTSPPINMAWVFYAPSQTLLSLSVLDAE